MIFDRVSSTRLARIAAKLVDLPLVPFPNS